MKIGICGGTFDPFHCGHLQPILSAREAMQWDRIVYMPAFTQPLKQDREVASSYHRFAMVVSGTIDCEAMYVSTMELERGHVSYTVDTLEELRRTHPEDTLDWIIGDDNLPQLGDWKSIDRIFALANFAVLTRGNHELPSAFADRVAEPQQRPTSGTISFTHNPTKVVSSTEIRRRIRNEEAIDELVPPLVSRYIHHYGLYRKGQS
jgi:nicotinate-nucleotide adenylyltransferase